jgi:coproporphyrinogen III oxidase
MSADPAVVERFKAEAPAWFATLRDRLCAALEKLEADAPGPFFPEAEAPGRFERKAWERPRPLRRPRRRRSDVP